MPLIGIDKRLKNIKRIRQILAVFAKYGFKDIIDRIPVARKIVPHKIQILFPRQSSAERLWLTLEELGPTFVKFGQLLSVRADILPPDFIYELSKLQDEVSPLPFGPIKKVVEDELKRSIETVFRRFDERPIASASLAQVHRAITKQGNEVVVKVQRPNIKQIIDTDLSITETLAGWVEREIEEAREYELVLKVREFARNLKFELNFTDEGRAVDRFRVNFRDDKSIIIPEVYWDLSTSKVLTLEYIEGRKITDPDILVKTGISQKEIVQRVVDFIFKQIFAYGFFHADPHPGNILVTMDGKIGLLDFGLTGSLDDELIENLASILTAGIRKDIPGLVNVLIEIGIVKEEINTREMRSDLRAFIDRYYGVSLAGIEVRNVIDEAFEISRRYRMRFPQDLVLLGKALSTVEGIAHKIDPEFNIIERLEPSVKQLIRRRYNLKQLLKVANRLLASYGLLFKNFANDLVPILKKIREGKLKVEFEHKGLENLISQAERSTNRLSFSLIIAALIIGSSLIIQTSRFLVLGILGFIIAGILGIGLVIAMLRARRL